MARKHKRDTLAIKGFFRVQIVDRDTGKVVGDSGYIQNQITNYGMAKCFVGGPAGDSGTVQVLGAMLGNGTNPASNATMLDTPNTDYYSSVTKAINNSTQAQFTQSFNGTLGAATIANVGLFGVATYAATNTMICGKTFASSAVATSQSVNLTYNLNYATS
jgi:hypothetical protein